MNVLAVTRPMPELAPVMTAIFPLSRDMAFSVVCVEAGEWSTAPASVWPNTGAGGPARLSSLSMLVQLGDQGIAERRGRHRLLARDQFAVDHHVGVPVGDALDPRTSFGEG